MKPEFQLEKSDEMEGKDLLLIWLLRMHAFVGHIIEFVGQVEKEETESRNGKLKRKAETES